MRGSAFQFYLFSAAPALLSVGFALMTKRESIVICWVSIAQILMLNVKHDFDPEGYMPLFDLID